MLIIRGVNVFPSEIERVLVGRDELSPHYQILLSKEGPLDSINIRVEMSEAFFANIKHELRSDRPIEDHEAVQSLTAHIIDTLYETLGVRVGARVVPPKTLPRSEGKAVRVVDQRPA